MGRPRTFDRDEALQQAMQLFWQHGYDSTSVSMLRSSMGGGITAPSFYSAFGCKEDLFREVVDHYVATYGQVNSSLWDDNLPPREAVELALRRSVKMQTESGHPRGCLLVVAASTCAPDNENVQQLLAKQRARTRNGFERCVQQAVDVGDLPEDTNVQAFAACLYSFLLGVSSQARDGIEFSILDCAASEVLRNWNIRTIKNDFGAVVD